MTKTIKDQLNNCAYADLSNFDPITNTYRIPRYTKPQFVIGRCYLIKINAEVINNRTSVLATNWNNGTAPQFEYYKAYVSKTMGKYIYVDCLAFNIETNQDINNMWSGWLEVPTLTQISVIS